MLSSKEFVQKAIDIVYEYANETFDKTDNVNFTKDNVYVVWCSYILGNIKALLSTTLPDGKYYEVTYNSSNNEIYFDAYVKIHNKKIEL